tara:strand:- start:73 stop:1032 length:960 start_codon:yes stop_codon:yes gene_type:complete
VSEEVNENIEIDVPVEESASAGSTGLLDDESSQASFDSSDDQSSMHDEQVGHSQNTVSERSFDPLYSDLDDEVMNTDNFYDNITEQDIKDLPTVARRMLHNFRVAYKNHKTELDTSHQNRINDYKKREQQIQSLERDFARRQAEFASVIDDPRIKEALNVSEDELPDLMSEEGIQAHINRGIAQAVSNVFSPMQQVSEEQRQRSRYLDFLEAHPEMKEKSFKNDVAELVADRRDSSAPLSTQDAYEIVRARRIMAEQRKRNETERRARADAARRVSRSSVSGSPGVAEIPPDVKKQGAASIAAWLQSNPEAAKAIANNR